ncbi:hypothetical protein K7432_000141 [Basidiobolus ranarum]|uniref:Uncharacterized protein n=1 Tax=Basidiobolus ranarum TaxID=34480 RepID=A0ABR2WBM1_9FUNG
MPNKQPPSSDGRDEGTTTAPGGKHPSASASKSTSRPAHTNDKPPNANQVGSSGRSNVQKGEKEQSN